LCQFSEITFAGSEVEDIPPMPILVDGISQRSASFEEKTSLDKAPATTTTSNFNESKKISNSFVDTFRLSRRTSKRTTLFLTGKKKDKKEKNEQNGKMDENKMRKLSDA